ncbi:MAG TPA: hypothetical protein ENI29_20660 [bacterium]|nr:hypothetical protein [bacterium]
MAIPSVSQYFGKEINLTIRYYDINKNISLIADSVTYTWDYGSGSISLDPVNSGYYTHELNTSLVSNVGLYKFKISASLENYTMISDFNVDINILERPTTLNGTTSVLYTSKSVYALISKNFTYDYVDSLTSNAIVGADEMSYNWQKLDENKDPIPGETGSGNLFISGTNRYILDLQTETMSLGEYFVSITLEKASYESRGAIISLIIQERPTTLNGSSPFTPPPTIIYQGDSVNFTLSYVDVLTSTPLTNLDNQSYSYTSTAPSDLSGQDSLAYDFSNQVYYLMNFDTASKPNGTYTITITLEKENYTSQTTQLSLVINYAIADYHSYLNWILLNPSNFSTDIFWRDNVTISFNFTTQYQLDPIQLAHPTSIWLQFRDESLSSMGSPISLINYNTSKGIYSYTFNTSQFLFIGGESYFINIYASKTDIQHTPPAPLSILFKVQAVLTNFTIHDYSTIIEYSSYTLTEYWNQTLGITFYFRELLSGAPITSAAITYSWAYGSGQINPDGPKGPGYYSFFFDAGNATEVGTYTITILALKQNFSNGVPSSSLIINIINRPTLLRPTGITDNNSVIFISAKIYALESEFFEFNYTDVFTSWMIKNADEASYNWQKLDEFGEPIPGESYIGTLIEAADRYILDLDTELMAVGEYFILITLDKLNYELRSAVLSLTIEDRETFVNGSIGGPFIINMGDSLNFTYSYLDNLTSTSITNLGTQSYTYNGTASGAGSLGYYSTNKTYYLDGFNTASLLNGTYLITIIFDKQNYTSQVVVISLVIDYILIDYRTFLTLISQNPSDFAIDIDWREDVTISFNFTTKFQSNPQALAHPTTISLQFLDESLSAMGPSINLINLNTSKGIYSYTFNTSQFSFIGDESYYMRFDASKTTPTIYTPPTPLLIFFKVQSVLANLTIHNFTTGTEFPSYTLTEYWNQTFGITFFYFEAISITPIDGAFLTFSWFYGSGMIQPDIAKGSGYYSFSFDTGNATEIGAYTITILAEKQNFSDGVPSSYLIINIINRPTMLNSSSDVLYVKKSSFVKEQFNFTFEFIDALTSNLIGNADEMSFILQKFDSNGNPIPGQVTIGNLIENFEHRYVLDISTESLQYGEYSIVVTLNKDKYDFRVTIISLTISKREFSSQASIPDKVGIKAGGALQFDITITDPNNNTANIIGAEVYIIISGTKYDFKDNGDGTYSLNIASISNPFFLPETYVGNITITKANFTTSSFKITVVVKITEIFPGVPTFYFSLIVGALIIGVGSLVGYRVIQQARIPTFVKKARKMKKEIKGEKSISESLIFPPKEIYLIKNLKDRWSKIGLDLEEILGLDKKKKKMSSEAKKDMKKTTKIVEKEKKKTKIKEEKKRSSEAKKEMKKAAKIMEKEKKKAEIKEEKVDTKEIKNDTTEKSENIEDPTGTPDTKKEDGGEM